tara:strand:- start:643 stop:747 length:105 start_codon:yes stop_codon:yes gene_type:complete
LLEKPSAEALGAFSGKKPDFSKLSSIAQQSNALL